MPLAKLVFRRRTLGESAPPAAPATYGVSPVPWCLARADLFVGRGRPGMRLPVRRRCVGMGIWPRVQHEDDAAAYRQRDSPGVRHRTQGVLFLTRRHSRVIRSPRVTLERRSSRPKANRSSSLATHRRVWLKRKVQRVAGQGSQEEEGLPRSHRRLASRYAKIGCKLGPMCSVTTAPNSVWGARS